MATHRDSESFIRRWSKASGTELANAQSFVRELCELLEVDMPEPAREDTRDNAYVFERRVTFRHGDGTTSEGRIDCYKRGHFVLESKKIRAQGKAFDDGMLRARGQAEGYARALPAEEGRPPFVLVVDVGNAIELYAEFSRSGATYTPFPDPRSHRIRLADLGDDNIRARLRAIWTDPTSLDPSRQSAKVTREVAERLAEVARVLEAAGHDPQRVASFLTRCLFSMFAEDVGLLPKRAFVDLLESLKDNPAQFVPLVGDLWKTMDAGGFCVAIRGEVVRFNGKLFKYPEVIPLDRDQIGLLLEAARANWREVEPAIFGTLLERALDPTERHSLGVHYTPRAYVERLVMPTIVEPLREDWKNAQAAALVLAGEGKLPEAQAEVRAFLHALTHVRVLDPACGSGNFLYVTLEHLKRLEGEVLNQLDELGDTQGRLELAGVSVDPHQLLGIEINPRAAEIAEMVLWIGYLQWHFRTRGHVMPPQPVLKDFHNIECRDAVLAYERVEFVTDERGVPLTRWDGITTKQHPVTGQDVPDESARIPLERYVRPRIAAWPATDFVVGNPPFIGNKRMRAALGDGYVDSLRAVSSDVPESADFVMYWWDKAADLAASGMIRRFGLITTNSLSMTFNRRVVERHLRSPSKMSIVFAVPDHPWVDSHDGAAVRISMTVGAPGQKVGRLELVTNEAPLLDGSAAITTVTREGTVLPNLHVGPDVTNMKRLRANSGLVFQGVIPIGDGFKLTEDDLASLGYSPSQLPPVIKPYIIGKDIVQTPKRRWIIDFFGLDEDEARRSFPQLYQRVFDRVRPERLLNRERSRRDRWWLFARSNEELRRAKDGLREFIATPDTSKFKPFVFVPGETLPDAQVYCIASDDPSILGVLSSEVHQAWLRRVAPTLEDRPRWKPAAVWDSFPFPYEERLRQLHVGKLARELHAHRALQADRHPELTLTDLYNVLEKRRAGNVLSSSERSIHEKGLIAVLASIHHKLDIAVLEAYGWQDLLTLLEKANGLVDLQSGMTPMTRLESRRAFDDAIVERLVALNLERANEERRGNVHWLRPELQNPPGKQEQQQQVLETADEQVAAAPVLKGRHPWPSTLPEQVRAVAEVLAQAGGPLDQEAIAAAFTGRGPWKRRLPQLLDTLIALGRAREAQTPGQFVSN